MRNFLLLLLCNSIAWFLVMNFVEDSTCPNLKKVDTTVGFQPSRKCQAGANLWIFGETLQIHGATGRGAGGFETWGLGGMSQVVVGNQSTDSLLICTYVSVSIFLSLS